MSPELQPLRVGLMWGLRQSAPDHWTAGAVCAREGVLVRLWVCWLSQVN